MGAGKILAMRERGKEVRQEEWVKKLSIEVTEIVEGDDDYYSCNIVFKAPEGKAQDSVHKELGELNSHMVTIRSSGHKAWEATELKYIRAEGQEAEEGDEVRKCLEGTFCLTQRRKCGHHKPDQQPLSSAGDQKVAECGSR